MEWEASRYGHSATSTCDLSNNSDLLMEWKQDLKSSPHLGDRKRWYVSFSERASEKMDFRPNLRITPLLPGCFQSLPAMAQVKHGLVHASAMAIVKSDSV
jgi:hypothetical protein